ncbi:MAG: SMP-30/gluconolactonase/LRE family protein [Deltaproteobacteria bacterium]
MKTKFNVMLSAAAVAAICFLIMPMSAQNKANIERLDKGLDALIPENATLEQLAGGFTWTEGPVWTRQGFVLFAEIPSNRIMEWKPGWKEATTYLQPSGYQGSAPYGGKEPGSNGMTLDKNGRLTVAGHARRCVFRLESLAKGAKLTVLAERYEGKRLSSPNDLVYRSDGSLYFTDPPYGLRTQSDKDPEKELSFNGVYRIPNALSHPGDAPPDDSKLQLLVKDLTRPNGIAFSPDEKYMYVAVSDPKHKVWMRYDVHPDGSVSNGRVFFDATSSKDPGLPDGMKVDKLGNIYSAAPGGIWIISPEGRHLGTIRMPEVTANCAWGDADGKTLYITASSHLYRIRLKVGGAKP